MRQDYIERLEADCDTFNADLPNLRSFILPGNPCFGVSARGAHRDPPRRAGDLGGIRRARRHDEPLTAQYQNRLSDLLFILGRVANPGGDVLWVPGGER